jgi:hypothetical protein
MKVATFTIRLKVENFKSDVQRKRGTLMSISGCLAVEHEPELNWEWHKTPQKSEVINHVDHATD